MYYNQKDIWILLFWHENSKEEMIFKFLARKFKKDYFFVIFKHCDNNAIFLKGSNIKGTKNGRK